jgi:hypothetical protein
MEERNLHEYKLGRPQTEHPDQRQGGDHGFKQLRQDAEVLLFFLGYSDLPLKGRDHRVEKGKRQSRPHATKYCASAQMFFRCSHVFFFTSILGSPLTMRAAVGLRRSVWILSESRGDGNAGRHSVGGNQISLPVHVGYFCPTPRKGLIGHGRSFPVQKPFTSQSFLHFDSGNSSCMPLNHTSGHWKPEDPTVQRVDFLHSSSSKWLIKPFGGVGQK